MRRMIATGTIGLTLTALALAPALATAAVGQRGAKAALTKKVVRADAQARKLITTARACPAAAGQRAITARVRAAQTKGLRAASATSLRQRHTRIATHTRRLAIAMTRCTTRATAAPVILAPTHGAPGAPGAPGTPGQGGGAGADGAVTLSLPLSGLGVAGIDLSGVLEGASLPAIIPAVPVGELLTSPLCAAAGAVCLGVDPQALSARLSATVADRVAALPLLGAVLTPLLSQVNATLAGAGAASLLDVQRVDDSVIRVVPTAGSALASLINLLATTGGLSGGPIGEVSIAR